MDNMTDSVDAYVPLLIWAAQQGPERVRQVAAGIYGLGHAHGMIQAVRDVRDAMAGRKVATDG